MKKTVFYLILLFSLSYLTSCTPPVQRADLPIQHADPFYNINHNDYPLLHLPLIKPIDAKRQDGSSPWRVFVHYGLGVSIPNSQEIYDWRVFVHYGLGVSIPNSQEIYVYNIEELEKFAVSNGVVMAYSVYVDKDADAYIQENYYHWFVIIPEKEIAEGFQTEDEFRKHIQTLGVEDPDWQMPDEAYEQFKRTGCLEWIPDCK